MIQPENECEFPASSILEKRNDARFLVQVMDEIAATNFCDRIYAIEVGVCDGGGSALILGQGYNTKLLSFSAPLTTLAPSENRDPPGFSRADGYVDPRKRYAGRWARERMSRELRDRWSVVYEDSHKADWQVQIDEHLRDADDPHTPLIDLIVIDGDHTAESVYLDCRQCLKIKRALHCTVLVHDSNLESVQDGVEDFSKDTLIPVVSVPYTSWYVFRPGASWTLRNLT